MGLRLRSMHSCASAGSATSPSPRCPPAVSGTLQTKFHTVQVLGSLLKGPLAVSCISHHHQLASSLDSFLCVDKHLHEHILLMAG